MTNQTQKDRIHELIQAINTALEARHSQERIRYKGAFGKVGIDRGNASNPHQADDTITGYMSKPALIQYLEAMLRGIYMTH